MYAYKLWKEQTVITYNTVDLHQEVNDMVSLTLGAGHYEIYYLDTFDRSKIIKITITESESFQGAGPGLMKWTELILSVEASSYSEAETIIKEFVNDAIKFSKKRKDANKVHIYIYEKFGGWRCNSTLPQRSMDTIYMDLTEKRRLITDITNFIADEQDYIEHGLPYKRCYLFEGAPGSGKSSTIFALASILNKDINIFNFSVDINDTMFISAISQTPSDRIIVFEDIDALFADRSPIDNNHVSISTFLNVLDGFCRKDKMLVFITTNYINRLDKAILRPGRIDYVLKFNFAVKPQIKQMYDRLRAELGSKEEFDAFYKVIANKKIGMSLIQKFLFEHRKDMSIMEYERELLTLIYSHEEKDLLGII